MMAIKKPPILSIKHRAHYSSIETMVLVTLKGLDVKRADVEEVFEFVGALKVEKYFTLMKIM